MGIHTEKPNIIYILADDMGYGDVSSLNEDSKIKTTHLDRLAQTGMIFRDAHASSAVCTPSRYSILTGRYNWRSILKEGVIWGYDEPIIERGRMTVPSFLKAHGYSTACVGKWHLGWHWARYSDDEDDIDYTRPIRGGPTDVGFDYFFGFSGSLDMAPYVYVENDKVTATPDQFTLGNWGMGFWRPGPIAPDFEHEEVLPKLTDKAVEYIDAKAQEDAPFFLYFPLSAPHTPILPTVEFQGRSGTNAYGDFCLQIDAVVGQIMQALEDNDIVDNTILIFTSDNGCSPTADLVELEAFGHKPCYVFRGYKADIYEGGHRIPLLVRWPQQIKAGGISDEIVCLADLLATCTDILGESLPSDAGEDSVSNLPIWSGQALDSPLREATIHSSYDGSLSIRQGRWKLEMCPGSGGWSYPRPGEESEGMPPLQLYDLEADIGERVNLSEQHADVVERLKALLTAYVRNGRSTPGAPQENVGGNEWAQLWWMVNQRNQLTRSNKS
ncbi:MAG: arylsulfatase [Chloroflexi bacterium]|nr:arylsulfatase [Chloroflexota bacterium]